MAIDSSALNDSSMQKMFAQITDLAKTLEDMSPRQDVTKNALSNNAVVLLPQFTEDVKKSEKISLHKLVHPTQEAKIEQNNKVAPR
jgi:hypothetical protein